VVGASAGVGRALSEALASHGYSLLLVASDTQDLQAQAAHLALTYRNTVKTVAADARHIDECVERIVMAVQEFGSVNDVFFPIGASSTHDSGMLPLENARYLLNVNFIMIVGVVSRLLPALLAANRGNIVGCGSIAAIRGRRVNVIYAAAKRGLESYFESLRHLTAGSGVRVQFHRLGYIATQQSFGARLWAPAISPQRVAHKILRDLGKDKGRTSFPSYWAIVAWLIRALPWAFFRRLDV
jgi:short-subunit dehydrogenase